MIIPVRCFTCGAVVANHYESYKEAVASGTEPQKALDATGLTRFCCRRMIVAHRDLIGEAAQYE